MKPSLVAEQIESIQIDFARGKARSNPRRYPGAIHHVSVIDMTISLEPFALMRISSSARSNK